MRLRHIGASIRYENGKTTFYDELEIILGCFGIIVCGIFTISSIYTGNLWEGHQTVEVISVNLSEGCLVLELSHNLNWPHSREGTGVNSDGCCI